MSTYSSTAKGCITSLKIVNCSEHQSQSLSIYFLKRTSFSDYAVLQVFLVGRERECTAVHYQHKYNRPH